MRKALHIIACQDRAGHRSDYVLQYQDDEMEEVFTADERQALAAGRVVVRGLAHYVDMTVLAAKTLDASF